MCVYKGTFLFSYNIGLYVDLNVERKTFLLLLFCSIRSPSICVLCCPWIHSSRIILSSSAISYKWVTLEALDCANEGRLASPAFLAVLCLVVALVASSNRWRETLRGSVVDVVEAVVVVVA